jgi:hypothetical protein
VHLIREETPDLATCFLSSCVGGNKPEGDGWVRLDQEATATLGASSGLP